MNVFVQCLLLVFLYMTTIFGIAVVKKDNSIVDVAWGFGFIALAWYSFLYAGLFLSRHILITALVTIWGLRISGHIGIRNWGKPEDFRYAAWRKAWKNYFLLRSFLQVFMLQGAVMFIVALPIVVINVSVDASLGWLDGVGVCVWLFGLLYETIGDYQLYVFLNNPNNRGRIITSGLWRHTRHPNYFGEAILWWGVWLIACSVLYGIYTIVSPILITVLLRYVSGVPMAEEPFKDNDAYQRYVRETSPFIPWFVQKGKE